MPFFPGERIRSTKPYACEIIYCQENRESRWNRLFTEWVIGGKKERKKKLLSARIYVYFIFGPLGITAFTLGFYFPPLTSINNYGQTQDYGQNTHPRVYRRKCLSQPPEEILHNVTILVVISAHLFLRKSRTYLSSLCLLASYRFGEVTGCYSKTLNSH